MCTLVCVHLQLSCLFALNGATYYYAYSYSRPSPCRVSCRVGFFSGGKYNLLAVFKGFRNYVLTSEQNLETNSIFTSEISYH